MVRAEDGNFVGMLFYNSNAQQISIKHSESGKAIINYRAAGGILDMYFLFGGSADTVIQQYNNLVGKPVLPPFWALGFQQCAWPYKDLDMMKAALKGYNDGGWPIETMWADIYYMDRYINFVVNENTDPSQAAPFNGLKDWVQELHADDMYFVPIVDAGIAVKSDKNGENFFETFRDERGAFLRSAQYPLKHAGVLIAEVWPGLCAFTDFLTPEGQNFWATGLDYLHSQIDFDGVWLDMNEIANFCEVGECPDKVTSEPGKRPSEESLTHDEDASKYASAPFTPGGPLWKKTISMDAYSAYNDLGYDMYHFHNLYATLETKATYQWMTNGDSVFGNKRPLIVSRASFPGHGQYGQVWQGDNHARLQNMQGSIAQMINFAMMGIPFNGADVCGFTGHTPPALCARWTQVGAFSPFFRNHYAEENEAEGADATTPHEFFLPEFEPFWPGMKKAIAQRYSLLRFMYTKLYRQSAYGEPVIRSMIYDFPDDEEVYGIQDSFLWGRELKVSIPMEAEETPSAYETYIPASRWLCLNDFKILDVASGAKTTLPNGFDEVNLHLREGSIIPMQDSEGVTRTAQLLTKGTQFIIFADKGGYAEGSIFIAAGKNRDEPQIEMALTYSAHTLQITRSDPGWTKLNPAEHPNAGIEYLMIVDSVVAAGTTPLFACAVNEKMESRSLVTERVGTGIKVTKEMDDTESFDIFSLLKISIGRKGEDFNYCERAYEVVSSVSDVSANAKIEKILGKRGDAAAKRLHFTAEMFSDDIVNIRIDEEAGNRFLVPDRPQPVPSNKDINAHVKVSVDAPFSATVLDAGGAELLTIADRGLQFADYYVELTTQVQTDRNIFGLGERVGEMILKPGTYTSWARDVPSPIEDGKWPGNNDYSVQPVYFTKHASTSRFHAVYNHNANA